MSPQIEFRRNMLLLADQCAESSARAYFRFRVISAFGSCSAIVISATTIIAHVDFFASSLMSIASIVLTYTANDSRKFAVEMQNSYLITRQEILNDFHKFEQPEGFDL